MSGRVRPGEVRQGQVSQVSNQVRSYCNQVIDEVQSQVVCFYRESASQLECAVQRCLLLSLANRKNCALPREMCCLAVPSLSLVSRKNCANQQEYNVLQCLLLPLASKKNCANGTGAVLWCLLLSLANRKKLCQPIEMRCFAVTPSVIGQSDNLCQPIRMRCPAVPPSVIG